MSKKSLPVLLALVLAATVAGSAIAACLAEDWPGYKPTQADLSAGTYLDWVIDRAQEYVNENGADAEQWVRVRNEATACKTDAHRHGTRTCYWYWTRCKTAWQKAQNRDYVACLSELNHSDPVTAVAPAPR